MTYLQNSPWKRWHFYIVAPHSCGGLLHFAAFQQLIKEKNNKLIQICQSAEVNSQEMNVEKTAEMHTYIEQWTQRKAAVRKVHRQGLQAMFHFGKEQFPFSEHFKQSLPLGPAIGI